MLVFICRIDFLVSGGVWGWSIVFNLGGWWLLVLFIKLGNILGGIGLVGKIMILILLFGEVVDIYIYIYCIFYILLIKIYI